jgi:hypothetical protein
MSTRVESLHQNLAGSISNLWQNTRVRSLLQILFLLGMGALATFAKSISLPLGIPGHSAVLWLGVMVAGRTLVNKNGAGTLMGASVALWAIPMSGLPEAVSSAGFFDNLALYGLTGLALDLSARIPRVNIRHWSGALLCGTLAHMVKFGFKMAITLFSPVVRHFLLVGVLKSLGLHILFGAMAGLLGWGAYKVWQIKQDSNKQAKISQWEPRDFASIK